MWPSHHGQGFVVVFPGKTQEKMDGCTLGVRTYSSHHSRLEALTDQCSRFCLHRTIQPKN